MVDAAISGGMSKGRGATAAAPGPMVDADGTPLRVSLARSLRRQKLRALLLISPLLLFILLTFVMPIADMLFRSVENNIVSETLPRTVAALREDGSEVPGEPVFRALAEDLQVAGSSQASSRPVTASVASSPQSSTSRPVPRSSEDIPEAS